MTAALAVQTLALPFTLVCIASLLHGLLEGERPLDWKGHLVLATLCLWVFGWAMAVSGP